MLLQPTMKINTINLSPETQQTSSKWRDLKRVLEALFRWESLSEYDPETNLRIGARNDELIEDGIHYYGNGPRNEKISPKEDFWQINRNWGTSYHGNGIRNEGTSPKDNLRKSF